MIFVQICVGSSCHLKGSQRIVELFQKYLKEYDLENDVVLSGSFCMGKCNRVGVTVQVDDVVHSGITENNYSDFFRANILDVVHRGGA